MPVLKRASKSRPSGQWSDDDYEVFDDEQHVGPPTSDSVLVLARWNDR
jgi:hypothetical protein